MRTFKLVGTRIVAEDTPPQLVSASPCSSCGPCSSQCSSDGIVAGKCYNGSCGSCAPSTNCQDANGPVMVSGCATRSVKHQLSETEKFAIGLNIQAYDMERIRYRLEEDGVVPPELIDTAIDEFRKYLTVIVNSAGQVAMVNPIIDEVWHAFILHTEEYARFTTEVLGWYLHHEPNTPWTPSSEESVPNFLEGYRALYGELHPIWNMRLS